MPNKLEKLKGLFKGIIFFLAFVMAVVSVSIYGDILKNQQKKIKHIENYPYTSSKLKKMPQGDWVKQSQLHKINLVRNGKLIKKSKYQYIAFKDILYLPFDEFRDRYGLDYTYLEADDVLEFVMNDIEVTIRMGSRIFLFGAEEKVFSHAPIIYNGAIFLPDEMLEFLEGLNGILVSWLIYKDLAYLNYFERKEVPQFLQRVSLMGNVIGVTGVMSENGQLIPTNKLGEIKEIENADGMVFIKGSLLSALGKIKADKFLLVRNFPANAILTEEKNSIYWIEDEVISFYDINNDKQFSLKKEDNKDLFGKKIILSAKKMGHMECVCYKSILGEENCYINLDGEKTLYKKVVRSPDHNFLLHYKDGWRLYAPLTNRHIAIVSSRITPRWISNSEFLYQTDHGFRIFRGYKGDSRPARKERLVYWKAVQNQVYITRSYIVAQIDTNSVGIAHRYTGKLNRINLPINISQEGFRIKERGNYIIFEGVSRLCIYHTNKKQIFLIKNDDLQYFTY